MTAAVRLAVTALAGTLPALLAVLLPAVAAGQPAGRPVTQPATQPVTLPTRDVSVRYQVEGEATSLLPGGLPGPVTLSWDAAGARVRAEGQGRNQVAVVNLRTRQGEVFDTKLRLVLPLQLRPGGLDPLTLNGARLTPAGSDTVAGLPCTLYTVAGRTGGTVCLSADGIPLRGSGEVEGRPGRFTALAVTYGAIAPALFAPPPGYMQLGNGGGGLNLHELGRSLLGGGRQ